MPAGHSTGLEYFGTQAARWSSLYEIKPAFRDRLSLFLGSLTRAMPPPGHVLDFGCGSGVISLAMAEFGYRVEAVDGSTRMIEAAVSEQRRRGTENVRFRVSDAQEFAAGPESFDAVVCSSVLQYVEDDRRLLAKLVGALRPGGLLLISVPNRNSLLGHVESASARLVRLRRFSGRAFLDYSHRRYSQRRFLPLLTSMAMGDFECTYFEVPVLGRLGIPLSRHPAVGVMMLVAARKVRDLGAVPSEGDAAVGTVRIGPTALELQASAPRTSNIGIAAVAGAMLSRITLATIYSAALLLHSVLRPFGGFLGPHRPIARGKNLKQRVLVIGTFYSKNWCLAHLTPLSRASIIERVVAVSDGPTPPIAGVTFAQPPRWLVRLVTRACAKFIWALREGLRARPDVVMGYHFFPGAISALLVARAFGARAAYQATGGPTEIIDGGVLTENPLLRNLRVASPLIESLALRIARRFDLVVVRGSNARQFMTERNFGHIVEVVPGSIEASRFAPTGMPRRYDVVSVGRLVPFKQPDHVLRILAQLRIVRPDFRAVIVGDGPMRNELEAMAVNLGIQENVEFAGHVEEVESILVQAKVFVLTSRSEGLSIAMAEAMASGAVPVVADVGDLGDLVRDGITGWLVTPGAFGEYADRVHGLLESPQRWRSISEAARAAAIDQTDVERVAKRWNDTLELVFDVQRRANRDAARAGRHFTARRARSRHRVWQSVPWRLKSALEPVCARIPAPVWLGRRYRETVAFIRRAERWSLAQVQRYQLAELRRLCEVAHHASPFYQSRFRECGFEPGDLKSLDDLRGLPLIDRDTVESDWTAICTRNPAARGVELVSTGGTSGRPLRFYIDARRSAVEYAYLVAGWARSGYTPELAQAVLRGEVVPENAVGLRHQLDPLLRRHYYSSFHMTDENMRRYLAHMSTIGPCYLLVYPSSVSVLARFMERTATPPPENVRGVLAGSEVVYPEDRACVERVLGVRCFSWYGHTEKLVMAVECEQCDDYHVWPTYGYFELLDETGQPVTQPGQRGEIVGTGFINTVMPFIRYRTGDFATYVGDHCDACGRAHPIIRDIRGHRTQEMLVASDGALISWTALNMHDDTFDRVRQFQFAQSVPGQATLRIVPAEGFGPENRERIRRNMARKLDGRLDFDVRCVESIALTQSGKTTYVDQQIDIENIDFPGAAV